MTSSVLKFWKLVFVFVGFLALCIFALRLSTKAQGFQRQNLEVLKFEAQEPRPQKLTWLQEKLTVGQSELNYLRKNSIPNWLRDIDIDKELNETQAVLTLHSYLDNIDVICRRKIRFGHLDDGGWEICDDIHVRPEPPCIIYSFGIANDWTFDDEVSRLYGCHVYAFDPSIEQDRHDRSKLIHFYPWGLAGITGAWPGKGWPMYTLQDIKEKLGHSDKVIDIVKMDIESSEWTALPQMVTSGQLNNVRQLLIEFHVTPGRKDVKIVQAIERLGFKKFYVHKNFHCRRRQVGFPVFRTSCYEVMYM
ncbi:hypothetical protein EGW08_010534, partial [Elysia chlorotica]